MTGTEPVADENVEPIIPPISDTGRRLVCVDPAEVAVIEAARALCADWDANRATSGKRLRAAVAALDAATSDGGTS